MNVTQKELWNDMESIANRVLSLRDCFQNDLYQMREDRYISKESLSETLQEMKFRHENIHSDLEDWVFKAKMLIFQILADIEVEEQNEQ